MADLARILLLFLPIFLLQRIQGEDSIEIVEPFPQSIFFLEFTSGDVTCVALDSSGAKDPPKISFMRRDDNNKYHKLKEDDNLFFRSRAERVGNKTKLFQTMVIRNVTLEDDSLYGKMGNYECNASTADKKKEAKISFNVNVITRKEIPKVTVTSDAQVLKHDEDLTLICNLTKRGKSSTTLEKISWYKDGVLLKSVKLGDPIKGMLSLEIKSVSAGDGGKYSCLLEVKLRNSLEYNVSDATLIRIAPWLPKPRKDIEQNLYNVEQKSFKGDDVSFECAAKGFPLEVEWKVKKKNEDTIQACINGTDERYKIDRGSIYDPFILTISDVQYSDRGFYYCCLPSNCSDNVKDNCQRFILRVRDPLGALWPAIGILIEAIVLFVIIFFAGKRKKNKEQSAKSD